MLGSQIGPLTGPFNHSWITEVSAVLLEWMVSMTILHVTCIFKLCPKVGWDNRLGSVMKEATGCAPLWLERPPAIIWVDMRLSSMFRQGCCPGSFVRWSYRLCSMIQQGNWLGFLLGMLHAVFIRAGT